MFNAFFPALEREKHTNMELENGKTTSFRGEGKCPTERAKPTNSTREKHDHKSAKPASKRE